MTNPAHCTCTRDTVRAYLTAAYVVEPNQVIAAIERHREVVEDGIRFGSHAYYAGDKIASAEGWPERDDYDIDEEDEEEDD